MTYQHKLANGQNVTVIDDKDNVPKPSGKGRGLLPRSSHPTFDKYGSSDLTTFEEAEIPLVDRSEWVDRFEEMDAKKMWPLWHIQWKPKDQLATNFCWANGPCGAAETVRVMQGFPYKELSSASVTCMVNGFVNQGGYALDAVQYMQSDGPCTVDLWPNTGIKRAYDTKESRAEREKYKTFEFIDLPTTFDAVVSALLCGYPCPVGYDWWRHAVFAVAAVALSSRSFGVIIRNSWGSSYGDTINGFSGYATLSESKGTPDDAQAIRAVTPSVQG